MFGDLLTDPHYYHGTCYQGYNTGKMEQNSRIGNHSTTEVCKPQSDGNGIEGTKANRAIAGYLIHFFLSFGTFLAKFFEIGNDAAQKLDHDGCSDVGHYSQGKNRSTFEVSAHEEIEQSKQSVSTLSGALKESSQRTGIHTGNGHKTAHAI